MKILKIDNGKGFYFTEDEYKEISELNSVDLLEILRVVYENNIEVDEEVSEIKNPANRIVYGEVLEQILKFNEDKKNIKDRLTREFSELDAMISSEIKDDNI